MYYLKVELSKGMDSNTLLNEHSLSKRHHEINRGVNLISLGDLVPIPSPIERERDGLFR